jgi:2'-5' RNA ligase
MPDADPAQSIYDRLWDEAAAAFAQRQVKLDPYLLNREADTRRGMTLIVRPVPAVIARILALLDRLRAIVPGQHFYRPDELHLTLLALINAVPDFNLDAVPLEAYRAVLDDLLPPVCPFELRFTGVSASPDSVFVCGHSPDNALNTLRDTLRERLAAAGLGGSLDRRYRIVTAHSTILRFQSPPETLPRLLEFLESVREHDLGAFEVREIEWVTNDWYMSHDRVRALGQYVLGGSSVG